MCKFDFGFYLLKEPSPANDRMFFKIDPSLSIKESLCGKTIIENPIVHILLPGSFGEYKVVPGLIQETDDPNSGSSVDTHN
jgi:hypothetical protein